VDVNTNGICNYLEYRRELIEHGFFVWRNLIPAALIDEHLAEFEYFNKRLGFNPVGATVTTFSRDESVALKRAQYLFHWNNPTTQVLLFNNALMSFLRSEFGEEPVLRQPTTGIVHRNTPPHVDSFEFTTFPAHSEIRLWCALEDISPAAGPVFFVKGSHRLMSASLMANTLQDHPEFGRALREQMRATTYPKFLHRTRELWASVRESFVRFDSESQGLRVAPALRKGDAVIFEPDVVHGTTRCLDERLTRKHLMSFWAGKTTYWYHARAYWGPGHDFRSDRTRLNGDVEITPLGHRIDYRSLAHAFQTFMSRDVSAEERR
jgi:ectoine hydroxylase-related dioxygenase (phytanoyl-CoA dioxygenase family)